MVARPSVLDRSPVPEGAGGVDALRSTIVLAVLADEPGCARPWLAGHRGGPAPAGVART